ncbi:hypothetical protein B0H13DRAFT_1906025 [Mycena leptocephala]|nr:hypothetical protein B0H13DRAFT_1906025 [Mycena leptocephala]
MEDIDPHYREMLKYPDAPNSWYFATLIVSIIIALMIGGFIHPGKPVANMFFVLFSYIIHYNSVTQAQLLLKDLMIARLYAVLMNSIIDNQRAILLSVEGTNIWSGQQPQQYNSQAVAWGGLSYYIGWLCVGINSSIFTYFSIAYVSQWWLRTRYPRWFTKYNYILAAAFDGRLWCSSSPSRCKVLLETPTSSRNGGVPTKTGIMTVAPLSQVEIFAYPADKHVDF